MEQLQTWITLVNNWLSDPQDSVQLQQWVDDAKFLAYTYEFTEELQDAADLILEKMEEQWKKKMEYQMKRKTPDTPSIDQLHELLNRKQIEQRTPEWYEQMGKVLTASELHHLFGSERERGKFVLSKTEPYVARNQPLAVQSGRMSAFDWGIRFEPVVKQIYEHKYGVTLRELGRLHHQEDPRCSASPDGLVYSCPEQIRTGRLIEIKCPVSREIDGTIPKEYYTQMQMQLHVTGLHTCDYVEAVFSSPYNQRELKAGPSLYDGFIAVVQYAEQQNGQDFYYVYSPIHAASDWTPELKEGEEMIEIVPWRLFQWHEQMVQRSEEWWLALQPKMEAFWEDVEKAKCGNFIVPESKRATNKSPKKKEQACLIQFHKMDENGAPLTI